MAILKVPKEVIVLLQDNDRWVIYNVFTRTCIGTKGNTVQLLGKLDNFDEQDIATLNTTQRYYIWEVGYFSNSKGLLHDPSRFIRNTSEWPSCLEVNMKELIKILKDKFLIITDAKGYRSRFQPMDSVLDRSHFGNFHQQLGQFLLTERKETPAAFWYKQKFTDDFKDIRNNLYKAVQEKFLLRYIPARFSDARLRVLDLGCGTGYYTNMIARAGADVIGVDINEKSLDFARENAPSNASYFARNVQDEDSLEFIKDKTIDIIFVSDTLLFYFTPLSPKDALTPEGFFRLARRVLKPCASLIILEPQYLFWLAPWLGEEEFPWTVFTEYLNRKFLVTPPFSKLFQSASRGGFVLKWMEELTPEEYFESVDRRAYYFAREFPLWHLFEFVNMETPE